MNGLILKLGGAPNTWHTVEGLPGYFHPKIPVPVDAAGFPNVEQAKAASKDRGCPVELVKASAADLKKGLSEVDGLRSKVNQAIRAQRARASVEQVAAEESAAVIEE